LTIIPELLKYNHMQKTVTYRKPIGGSG